MNLIICADVRQFHQDYISDWNYSEKFWGSAYMNEKLNWGLK